MPENLQEFRCSKCNKLLAKTDGNGVVEILCPRCKTLNAKGN